MKVAAMQPYLFPYAGYCQLYYSADVFIFLDDVSFIKKGWINRNGILLQQQRHEISFPVAGISQNKFINQHTFAFDEIFTAKFFKLLEHSYKKAPFYHET